MSRVCSDCLFKCIQFGDTKDHDSVLISDDRESALGNMYGKCRDGNTALLLSFYTEYGDKPKDTYKDLVYPCFEETYFEKEMNKLLANLYNLSNSINKDKGQGNEGT